MSRRSPALLAIPAFGLLFACAPQAEAPAPEPVALDCARSFGAQRAAIVAQPGLRPAPDSPGEPYAYYSSEDASTSWVITRPGAPGHPAIVMQRAQGGQVATTGCPYADLEAFRRLTAYLEGLKVGRGDARP